MVQVNKNKMETKSEIKEEPLFSLKNYLKPTSKNILIWGDILIALGTMIGANALATGIPVVGFIGMSISGIGIILQRLTREKPVDTLVQAVEDIKEDKTNAKD